MEAIVQEKIPELAALCRRHRVKQLEVFGSATTGRFDPAKSDLDFLVEFLPGADLAFAGSLLELKEDLEVLFGRKVDVMINRPIQNPFKRKSIEASRRLVYAA
jgi:predicted nucleotidyltransferase